MGQKKIKVMIVEDSPIKREVLIHILKSDSEIEVMDYVPDSIGALKLLDTIKPDLITMDIDIPGGMDGFELTELILKTKPIPIIVISALRTKENKYDIEKAMSKSGALYFLDSPPGPWSPDFENSSKEIIRIVKLVSGKKIPDIKSTTDDSSSFSIPDKKEMPYAPAKIIVIGVSTGGPAILQKIFPKLPPAFHIPIVAVQHISKGFDEIMAKHLCSSCHILVKLAEDDEMIKHGCIYIAPADKITEIRNNRIVLHPFPEDYTGYKPSISSVFESVINYGENAIGIILTGMGRDGVAALKKMRDAGAVTIAQDEKSSVVFGMPKEAINNGGAKYVMSPEEIINFLINLK